MKRLPGALALTLLFASSALAPVAGQTVPLTVDTEWTLPLSADPNRPFADDHSGARTVAGPFDLDGDGNPDLLVSDYTGGGRAHMLEYGPSGWTHVASTPWLDAQSSTINARVIEGGDLDGDGLGEVYILTGFGFDASSPYGPGLFVFEIVADNSFGSVPTAIYDFAPDTPDRWRAEQMTAVDLDGDGAQELIFGNNGSNNRYDNWYVLSVTGDIGSGSETFVEELRLSSRDTETFDPVNRGGGSAYGSVPADLDGDGNLDLALQSWNNLNFTNISATGPNAYAVPGAADPNVWFHAAPSDQVAFFGCEAFDLDMNGDDEVLCGSLQTSNVSILNYESGENPLEVVGANLAFEAIPGLSDSALAIEDLDGNGTPDLIGIGPSYGANEWANGWVPAWFGVSSFLGGDVEVPGNYAAVDYPAFMGEGHFSFQTVRWPDGSVTYENGPEGPIFASKLAVLGDIDSDGRVEFAAAFQGIEDYLNVFDDDGGGNRTLISSTENPHRTFLRILEAGDAQLASIPDIQALLPLEVAQLDTEGSALDSGTLPGRVFNSFVGRNVTFDAVIMSDPLASGLANPDGAGDPSRLHVFVRDIAGTSSLGSTSRTIQLVDGDYSATGLINATVGDVVRVDGIVAPFGQVMQVAPNSVTILGTAIGMGLPPDLMDPIPVTTADINKPVPPGFQANWPNFSSLRDEYVAITGAIVMGSDATSSRPNFWVSTDGGATGISIYDTSLRYRNDRSSYSNLFDVRTSAFVPPPVGAEVDISGFLILQTDDPFGFHNPQFAALSLVPFSDADLNVTMLPPPPPQVTGVTGHAQGWYNQITWDPGAPAARAYVMDRPFGQADIESGAAVPLGDFDGSTTEAWHHFEAPTASMVPIVLHYAVTSLSAAGGVENTAANSIPLENGGFRLSGNIPEINAAGVATLDANLGIGTASGDGLPPNSVPFELGPSHFSRVTGGGQPADDNDLSGDAWLGFSSAGDIYIYAEVVDDVLDLVPAGGCAGCDAWNYDSIELGWGSYDVRDVAGGSLLGSPHDTFGRGAEPDYQIRLTWVQDGTTSTLANLNPGETEIPGATTVFEPLMNGGSTVGYKVLSRIPLSGLAAVSPGDAELQVPGTEDLALIPFTIALNDRDGGGSRESQINFAYGPTVSGNWWNTPSEWPVVALEGGLPTGLINFDVDITPLELINVFDASAGDLMEVRGTFNGWGCGDPTICVMTPQGDGVWRLTVPFTAATGSNHEYKFYAGLDPARFAPDPPPPGWEEPATSGGANRSFTFPGQDLTIPVDFFSDYLPGNVVPGGIQVDTRFQVDMNGAPGFTPGTDKVFINLGLDGLWAYTQGVGFGEPFEMLDPDGDGIFELIFPLMGPTFGGIQYTYGFGPDGLSQTGTEQGAGFSGAGRKRLRWVSPGQGGFPAAFDFPVDMYQATGALPVEENPAQILAVDDNVSGLEDGPISIQPLANDIDPLGEGLTLTSVGDPQHGMVDVPTSASGHVIYTPPAEYSGSDQFTYTMSDASGQTASGTVYITIAAVNDPPRAAPDQVTTDKAKPVTFNPLQNDSDIEGDALTLISVDAPPGGSVSLDGSQVTYTPNPGFAGSESFEYVISDGTNTARGAIIMTVNDVNVPPEATDDTATTPEETPVAIDVLANDTDVDNDPLTVMLSGTPTGGTTALNGDNTITFTPAANFTGAGTFMYTVTDPEGAWDQATVTITVTQVNDAPVAVDDTRNAFEGVSADFDVLANDTDADNDALILASVGTASSGSTSIVGGKVRYVPAGGTSSTDSFTYVVSDGNGGTDSGTVTVTVQSLPPDNDGVDEQTEANAPNGGDGNGDGIPDSEQANVASLVSGTSGNYITVATEPGSEVVAVTSSPTPPSPPEDPPPAEASFPTGYLDFQLQGGTGNAARTVTITTTDPANTYYKYGPTPANPTPHWYQFLYDGETGAVINGNEITLHFVDGKRGDDDLTANGTIVDPGAPALIPNEVPVAGQDVLTLDEDTSTQVDVLANDSDADGDILTVASVSSPSNGSATRVGSTVTYTPNPEFSGTDSFTYVVSDGRGGTVTGQVTITVTAVNDAPVAEADSYTVDEDELLMVTGLLDNDTDAEGSTIRLSRIFAAQHGQAIVSNGGAVSYRPPAEFSGTDSFWYTVTDGTIESERGEVSITVNAVNDAPTAQEDFLTLEGGATSTSGNVLVNDSDVDSATLQVTAVSTPSLGSATFTSDGTVTYAPGAGFVNMDTFTYTVTDGDGASSEGTVSVTLGAVPPVTGADAGSTDEEVAITIDVLANDSDPNGDAVTVTAVSEPANGTATIESDQTILYTPETDFFGEDTFTYTASDGALTSTGTVRVEVAGVNDAPRFDAGSPVFVHPAAGSSVEIGFATLEDPMDPESDFTVEFESATDPEGTALTYTWTASLSEDFSDPKLEQETSDTSFTLKVTELLELLDGDPGASATAYHRIEATDGELSSTSETETVTLVRGYITGIDEETIPKEFELHQNYPNPFNPRTRIKYAVPVSGRVQMILFDALGRRVATLVDGTVTAGYHELLFDASRLTSGMYIYVMRAEGFVRSRAFVLMR